MPLPTICWGGAEEAYCTCHWAPAVSAQFTELVLIYKALHSLSPLVPPKAPCMHLPFNIGKGSFVLDATSARG